jgi:hypothetical protein
MTTVERWILYFSFTLAVSGFLVNIIQAFWIDGLEKRISK